MCCTSGKILLSRADLPAVDAPVAVVHSKMIDWLYNIYQNLGYAGFYESKPKL